MFKTIHNLTLSYLRELFDLRSTGHNLRNSKNALFAPKPRTNYVIRTPARQSCKSVSFVEDSILYYSITVLFARFVIHLSTSLNINVTVLY